MLVLRNGSNVMAEGGKPLGNNEVNALKVENTNAFSFGVVTTGPIRVYWGDGSYSDVGVKSTRYDVTKNYGSIGNWNISITGAENVVEIYFDNRTYSNKIITNVVWFKQFSNIQRINVYDASFIGDLAPVLESLPKMRKILIDYLYSSTMYLNVSNCKKFWSRCLSVKIVDTPRNIIRGSYSDVDLCLDCEIISFSYTNIGGDFSGIIKNGYRALTTFNVFIYGTATQGSMINLEDWVIPETLMFITNIRGLIGSHGSLNNFNFKNLLYFATEGTYSSCDLRNNQSFDFAIANNLSSFSVAGVGDCYLYFDLSKFTKSNYGTINLTSSDGYNRSFGDLGIIAKKVSESLTIMGGSKDGKISGVLDTNFKPTIVVSLSQINVTISAEIIKFIFSKSAYCNLSSLPNATGDISGCYFNVHYSGWKILISQMPNLYADITTFSFNQSYANEYGGILFYSNPHFTGDLVNFPLWVNKDIINLSSCAYTNIHGFVRKIFANRNNCLKAAGGMTNIQVQGNVDNSSLTGMYQQPNLGTYTGNLNDLTESQIDNLANGLDHTGTGTSTPWTDKEKIWFMVNCKNSSTDTSLRYRVTINY